MADKEAFGRTAESPADDWVAVTPHDSTNLTYRAKSIYVGGAGNLVAVAQDGSAVTFTAVPAGTVLPIRPIRINATNTTATAIVALY